MAGAPARLAQSLLAFFAIVLLGAFSFSNPVTAQVALPAPEPMDIRFGLVEPHDAPEQAALLHAAWGRARFHWGLIQPHSPEEWIDAELSDEELAREISSGREVVGLLIGVPEWARGGAGLPRGLYLSPDDPENLWAVFVRAIVGRYTGRIDRWIIWNEPDIWDTTHPGFTWPGTAEDYVQLLRISYQVARSVNPESKIHLAAMSHWWDVQYGRELYFQRLMNAIVAQPDAKQNDYFYDAATVHLYFNPAAVYDVTTQYRELQSQYGIEKPLWLVETNAAPSGDPSWAVPEPTFRVSLVEQAAYAPQAIALALAAGADRIGIYKLIDTEGDYAANPEPFGLLRADLTPRPAYRSVQVAFDQLAGVDHMVWASRGVVSQVIASRPGEIMRVFWSRIPHAFSVTVPALTNQAEVMDMWGNSFTVSPIDSSYTLTLLSGECQETTGDYCMIGGPPLYVVERVSEGAQPNDFDSLSVEYSLFDGEQGHIENNRITIHILLIVLLGVGLFALMACGAILKERTTRTGHPDGPTAK